MKSQENIKEIFKYLGVSDLPLLGEGGEAQVLDYKENKVLKIFKSIPNNSDIDKLNSLYKLIATKSFTFKTPEIIEIKKYKDTIFLIEKKLSGEIASKVYPNLKEDERRLMLLNYFNAVEQFSTVQLNNNPYGQFMIENNESNWQTFIERNAQSKAEAINTPLKEDKVSYEKVIQKFKQDVKLLSPNPKKALIHGDYFFENVMIDKSLNISSVFDFGWWTCIGDHLMDVAGAIMFLDLYDYVSPREKEFLANIIIKKYGKEVFNILTIYKIYYSLLLADCKQFDPKAYKWSITNLQNYLADV